MSKTSLKLCVEAVISVALKPFNYHIHGHDVFIEACWCGSLDKRVDIEVLARTLYDALRFYDRRPLWESLGSGKAMVEDLLLKLSGELGKVEGLELCGLKARWSGRSVELNF